MLARYRGTATVWARHDMPDHGLLGNLARSSVIAPKA